MCGMLLSYLAVTTTRISHNVFVFLDKWDKEYYYFTEKELELVQQAINHCLNKENVYEMQNKTNSHNYV